MSFDRPIEKKEKVALPLAPALSSTATSMHSLSSSTPLSTSITSGPASPPLEEEKKWTTLETTSPGGTYRRITFCTEFPPSPSTREMPREIGGGARRSRRPGYNDSLSSVPSDDDLSTISPGKPREKNGDGISKKTHGSRAGYF